jgi:hypothetical protein
MTSFLVDFLSWNSSINLLLSTACRTRWKFSIFILSFLQSNLQCYAEVIFTVLLGTQPYAMLFIFETHLLCNDSLFINKKPWFRRSIVTSRTKTQGLKAISYTVWYLQEQAVRPYTVTRTYNNTYNRVNFSAFNVMQIQIYCAGLMFDHIVCFIWFFYAH